MIVCVKIIGGIEYIGEVKVPEGKSAWWRVTEGYRDIQLHFPLEVLEYNGAYSMIDPLIMSDDQEMRILTDKIVTIYNPLDVTQEYYKKAYSLYRGEMFEARKKAMHKSFDVLKSPSAFLTEGLLN